MKWASLVAGSAKRRLLFTAGAFCLALLVRWPLQMVLADRYPYLAFFPFIALVAFYARWKMALLFIAGVAVAAEPAVWQRHTFDLQQAAALLAFLPVAGVITACMEAMHRACAESEMLLREAQESRQHAVDLNEQLETRVRERTNELLMSNAHLRSILNGAPDPMAVVDMELRLTSFNRAYAEEFRARFGSTPEMGARLDDLLSHLPEEQAKLMHLWEAALAGESVSREYHGDPALGRRYFELRSSFLRDSAGRPTHLVYSARDMTDQRDLEERLKQVNEDLEKQVTTRTGELIEAMRALEASGDQLRLVLDNVPVGVIYCDGERRLRFANRFYAERFGKQAGQIVGQPMADVCPNTYQAFASELERALQGEAVRAERETTIGRVSNCVIILACAPDRAPDGSVRGFVAMIADITEQKRVESALRDAETLLRQQTLELEKTVAARTAKLTETVTELESFAYSVAHDLRAPLRAITSLITLLQTEFSHDASVAACDFMDRIQRAAKRMDDLIRDLLILSRVGRVELNAVPMDLDHLVQTLISENPELQPPKSEMVVQAPLGVVQGNEMLLTQVVSNLLGNAVKFVSPGTVPQVTVRSEVASGQVRVWIEDNGIGIDPRYHKKVFGVFERLDTRYEGTGVGLAIVRRAVERLGGDLGLESAVGQGSKFWIRLPGSSSPAATESAGGRTATAPAPLGQASL